MTARHAREVVERYDRGFAPSTPAPLDSDEASIPFARAADGPGQFRELPEPLAMATILLAIEGERTGFVPAITGAGGELLEACAPILWPLLVVPTPNPPNVAIFDGTGVWQRKFRYSRLPTLSEIRSSLAEDRTGAAWLGWLREAAQTFGPETRSEEMTIEGFLPIDPTLLFDVLSSVEMTSGPGKSPAGCLPARHDSSWYSTSVKNMDGWLQRFDQDLVDLAALKERIHDRMGSALRTLDKEDREFGIIVQGRIRAAHEEMDRETDELHRTVREEVRSAGHAIRQSRVQVARSRAQATAAETFASRSVQRREDPEVHHEKSRRHQQEVRDGEHALREAHRKAEAAQERERRVLDTLSQKVAQVEEEGATEISRHELFRDELGQALEHLYQAIDGQMTARSSQRQQLGSYYLPLPSLSKIRVVWFPLWVGTLAGPRGIRFRVFPPMQVAAPSGLSARIKSLFGGVVLPLEPRAAQFDQAFREKIEAALERDAWLTQTVRELVRAADVISQPEFLDQLIEGLAELRRAGWVTAKREGRLLQQFSLMAASRSVVPPSPTPPLSPPKPEAGS